MSNKVEATFHGGPRPAAVTLIVDVSAYVAPSADDDGDTIIRGGD